MKLTFGSAEPSHSYTYYHSCNGYVEWENDILTIEGHDLNFRGNFLEAIEYVFENQRRYDHNGAGRNLRKAIRKIGQSIEIKIQWNSVVRKFEVIEG